MRGTAPIYSQMGGWNSPTFCWGFFFFWVRWKGTHVRKNDKKIEVKPEWEKKKVKQSSSMSRWHSQALITLPWFIRVRLCPRFLHGYALLSAVVSWKQENTNIYCRGITDGFYKWLSSLCSLWDSYALVQSDTAPNAQCVLFSFNICSGLFWTFQLQYVLFCSTRFCSVLWL